MHVRVRLMGHPESIVVVDSKLTKIEDFRKLIQGKFDIKPNLQRLFYGGKLLENGYNFHDYNIKINDVIQLMVKILPVEDASEKTKDQDTCQDANKKKEIYKDTESILYSIGDLIDMKDKEEGAWYEGKIVRIVHDPNYVEHKENSENTPPNNPSSSDNTSPTSTSKKKGIADFFNSAKKDSQKKVSKTETQESEEGLLYKVVLEDDDPDTDYYCKLKEIRPRARRVIDVPDLKVGQRVMVNHNTENSREKGLWYDFKISEIKKLRTTHELIGTLYLGLEEVPQNDTKVRIVDKIYAIETVVSLAKRSEELKTLMVTPTEKRSSPLNCTTCRDDEGAKCRDCGCYICSGKESPDKIILCDECNMGYHMDCLSPPLDKLPDDEWYCPSCKRDTKSVVAPGAAKQTKKANPSKTKRDWGRGMACVGKTKTCTMPPNHFGPIPGIDVGMCWRYRIQLSETGVHRPPVSGIHGRDVEGAYSIVLSGGYEDDVDHGDEFTYTGSGGRDLSGNKRTAEQSCDQTLTRENKALARNCAVKKISEEGGDAGDNWKEGRPVRVVRSYKMLKHFPEYAPKEGIRYDGIYKVVKYYPEKGKSGYKVWKYLLRRDDPNPAPWEDGAKHYDIIYPDGFLEAEAEKKAQKEKKAKGKTGTKRTLRDSTNGHNSNSDDGNEKSPPQKRKKKNGDITKNSNESPKGKIPAIFNIGSAKKERKIDTNKEVESILDQDVLDAIKADTRNTKLWDECIDVCKNSGKKEFVDSVAQLFLCIICQEVCASPVTTTCLHNFCLGCIKLAFKSTGSQCCPHCRQDLSKEYPGPNEELKLALRTIMPGYDAGKK